MVPGEKLRNCMSSRTRRPVQSSSCRYSANGIGRQPLFEARAAWTGSEPADSDNSGAFVFPIGLPGDRLDQRSHELRQAGQARAHFGQALWDGRIYRQFRVCRLVSCFVKSDSADLSLSPFTPRKPRIFRGAKGENTRQPEFSPVTKALNGSTCKTAFFQQNRSRKSSLQRLARAIFD